MEEGLDNLVYLGNKNGVIKISSKLCKDMHLDYKGRESPSGNERRSYPVN